MAITLNPTFDLTIRNPFNPSDLSNHGELNPKRYLAKFYARRIDPNSNYWEYEDYFRSIIGGYFGVTHDADFPTNFETLSSNYSARAFIKGNDRFRKHIPSYILDLLEVLNFQDFEYAFEGFYRHFDDPYDTNDYDNERIETPGDLAKFITEYNSHDPGTSDPNYPLSHDNLYRNLARPGNFETCMRAINDYFTTAGTKMHEALCSILSCLLGGYWDYREIRGSCQSEWNYLYYDREYLTKKDIFTIESVVFGNYDLYELSVLMLNQNHLPTMDLCPPAAPRDIDPDRENHPYLRTKEQVQATLDKLDYETVVTKGMGEIIGDFSDACVYYEDWGLMMSDILRYPSDSIKQHLSSDCEFYDLEVVEH